jgi:hypothetical protein
MIADLDSGDLDGYTLMALRTRLASNDLMALYAHSTQAFHSNTITFLPVFLFFFDNIVGATYQRHCL